MAGADVLIWPTIVSSAANNAQVVDFRCLEYRLNWFWDLYFLVMWNSYKNFFFEMAYIWIKTWWFQAWETWVYEHHKFVCFGWLPRFQLHILALTSHICFVDYNLARGKMNTKCVTCKSYGSSSNIKIK